MSGIRPFLRWPDPRLKAVAAPVAAIDDAVRAIWSEMIAAMIAMPGVGLAAPQLGIGRALAVVDPSGSGAQVIRMANPELLWASPEERAGTEASPNLPGVSAEIVRPVAARIGYLDEHGERVETLLHELAARSALHQIDHLAGRLYIDRLSALKRSRLVERYRKQQRQAGRAR
ncbi:peptide deformylase [Paralimibaculum aggregatum]|uniref:Peptide deformylase-like n=1 Tax=Paralimibaculum aggregatum TaxID=3036245 RepID=A0ABQ6LKR7_9RHOB|nr:peptide deformylase [Limibaculum sp. NKW23]GMG80976.1 peptide deformylase [Limibaculum sp. NKW23]